MRSNIIDKKYLDEYMCLPETHRWINIDKKEWRITNMKFEEFLNSGPSKIDFLWFSLNINLFSKTIYNFCPECYTYCNHYIYWKFGNPDLLKYIYRSKYSELVDEKYKNLSPEQQYLFYSHSLNNIEKYSNQFIEILKYFEKEIHEINHINIIKKAVDSYFFLEEFSKNDEDLSNLFLNKIINYASN
jgi:hypothetical protein